MLLNHLSVILNHPVRISVVESVPYTGYSENFIVGTYNTDKAELFKLSLEHRNCLMKMRDSLCVDEHSWLWTPQQQRTFLSILWFPGIRTH